MGETRPYYRAMLDTNVLWAAFSRQPSSGRGVAERILRGAEGHKFELFVSALTLVELFNLEGDEADTSRLVVINQVLASPWINVIELTGQLAVRGRDLGHQWRIQNAHDLAILASAEYANVDVFMTWDGDDFTLGTHYGNVFVTEPYTWWDLPKPDAEPQLLTEDLRPAQMDLVVDVGGDVNEDPADAVDDDLLDDVDDDLVDEAGRGRR